MDNKYDIFVYGTLLFPEIVFKLTGKEFIGEKFILDNYKIYNIFDGEDKREFNLNGKNIIFYCFKKEFINKLKGKWDINEFKKLYLKKYLEEIIPRVLSNFNKKINK